MKNGILLVDKPKDLTSRQVVNQLCKIYKTKKVGHTGTLDPLATGVLIVCLGTYTKFVSAISAYDKEYVATMQFGILTDTLDLEGNILKEEKVNISEKEIRQVFDDYPKTYWQTVPKYSAVKVNGKKLYEYARENKEVELPKRKVEIKKIEILEINKPYVTFKVIVSKGTYIRSLILDLAKSLNTVATMVSLRRIRQGDFSILNCIPLAKINENTPLLLVTDLFAYLKVEVSEKDYKKVLNGNTLNLTNDDLRIIVTYKHKDVALYEKKEGCYHFLMKL